MTLTMCPVCFDSCVKIYADKFYLHQGVVYDLVRCTQCGLVRVDPMPTPEEVTRFYDRQYFEKDSNDLLQRAGYFDSSEILGARYEEILHWVEKFRSAPGRFLDVGCAGGEFLQVARQKGWEPTGLDVSKAAVQEARQRCPERVILGREETLLGEGAQFDLIHCGHTLEHMPDPAGFLLNAHRLLVKGGHLVVEVPSYVNSVYFSIARLLSRLRQHKGGRDAAVFQGLKVQGGPLLQAPYHLFEFNNRTLRRLLENQGFRVLSIRQWVSLPPEPSRHASLFRRLLQLTFRALNRLAQWGVLPGGQVLMICQKEPKARS